MSYNNFHIFVNYILLVLSNGCFMETINADTINEDLRYCLNSTDRYSGTCKRLSTCLKRPKAAPESVHTFRRYNCQCDNQCSVYRDCCEDASYNIQDSMLVNSSESIQEPYFKRYMSCRKITGIMSFNLTVNIVDRCPAEWLTLPEKQMCEMPLANSSLVSRTPVTNKAGILFQNMYCAMCHSIEEIVFWNVNANCRKDDRSKFENARTGLLENAFIDYISNVSFCDISFDPPSDEFGVRFCKPMISSCASSWISNVNVCTQKLCEDNTSGISLVYEPQKGIIYKNKHCAKCNHETDYSCTDRITRVITPNTLFPGLVPLNLLIDFNNHKLTGYKFNRRRKKSRLFTQNIRSCPYKQVYDPNTATCINIFCQSGGLNFDGKCKTSNKTETKLAKFESLSNNSTSDTSHGCVYVVIPDSKFIDDNHTLITSPSYNGGEYIKQNYIKLSNGSVAICTNFSRNYTVQMLGSNEEPLMDVDHIQWKISIIGQLLSIAGLSILLIIYSILPPLRNLAGKNLMSLAASLLAAQTIFIAGVDKTTIYAACISISVAIHYTFLASFFWMNIMSFDIWHTFSKCSRSSDNIQSKFKLFVKYSVYGWVSPLIIVIVGVATNYLLPKENNLRPGFGENICWFRNKWAFVIFFELPIALIVFSNLLFYFFTIYSIHKVSQNTKTATGKSPNMCRFILYIKICLIMGLTWIFAFIAKLTNQSVWWYVFIVCNSYQGIFICLSFVLTKKVLRLLKVRWYKIYQCVRYDAVNQDEQHQTDKSTKITNMSLSHSHDWHRRISRDKMGLQVVNNQYVVIKH